jgi:DNA-binding MarR family transcriptional regulator
MTRALKLLTNLKRVYILLLSMSDVNATSPTPALSSGIMCAAGNLRRANRVVSRFYDTVLRPSGIRATQYTTLSIIAARGPVSVNQLAKMLVMDRTTLARDLKPLERQGFVKVSIDTADNRVRLAMITEQGREALKNAAPLWREAQQRMTQVFGEERLLRIISELQEVVKLSPKA